MLMDETTEPVSYDLLHPANAPHSHLRPEGEGILCGHVTTGAVRMVGIVPASSATCPSCRSIAGVSA